MSGLGMASIGIGGKGDSDSRDAAKHGDMVAVCDVDKKPSGRSLKRFPGAKGYTDFRKMLDEMGKSIDAVTVSTPDHMHAPASLMAMRMGIHCFCQKPLTRTIYEARLVGQVARENKVATQMGNQGTAGDSLRRSAHWLKNGAIGTVKELHIWTDRAKGWWPQGVDRPAARHASGSSCPGTSGWAWLPSGPTAPVTIPSNGVAGGISEPERWATSPAMWSACPSWALICETPFPLSAKTSGHNKDSFPEWSIITFEFAATQCAAGSDTHLVRRWQASAQGTARRSRSVAQRWLAGDWREGNSAERSAAGRRREPVDVRVPAFARSFRGMDPSDQRQASRPCPTSPTTPARSPKPCCWATWQSGPVKRSSGMPPT